MPKRAPHLPPDQDQRDRILRDLDVTMLVEAAAGTGKTTCLVGRMLQLIAQGKCRIHTLAAVTFTRKAAAELRSRFAVKLDQEARNTTGEQQERLRAAADHVEQCFIGTIHSFCGRLLRERPIEAGVAVGFEELDEIADLQERTEAWHQFVARLFATDSPILAKLDEVGLRIDQVKPAYLKIVDYSDVEEWPVGPEPLPNLRPALKQLQAYVREMAELLPSLPQDPGNDNLMPCYSRIVRMMRYADLNRPADIMGILEQFRKVTIVQRNWPGGPAQAKQQLQQWDAFRQDCAEPMLLAWRSCRYVRAMQALRPAVEFYAKWRADHGQLNFQDLLIGAVSLLRSQPHIRRYFRQRFTHVLVDEFQDTDPIQAEVMLLLTADDTHEPNWRRCRPVKGALFVVGDPKQSIYRFRRADIITYEQVKRIIVDSGGQVATLSANFRGTEKLIDWVNRVFDDLLGDKPTPFSPAQVALQPGHRDHVTGQIDGVYTLAIPDSCGDTEEATQYDASCVARFIRHALDSGLTVSRTPKELEAGVPPQVRPGDFLVLAPTRKYLSLYAQKLQELGVPHQVNGGASLNDSAELALLHRCLQALVEPDNPVALVAALRSELFGISDEQLYAFRRAGGRFDFRLKMPEGLDADAREALGDTYGRLGRYAAWLHHMPAVAAIERIVADAGLAVAGSLTDDGQARAGAVAKTIELLRGAQRQSWTAADLANYLGQLLADEQDKEKHDGISALPDAEAPVRLMNLHRAKGLEAPIVFLASPSGGRVREPDLCVDRTADRIRGHLPIREEPNKYGYSRLLACPSDWDNLAATEQQFADAEKKRLLYVAATRAGGAMIISQRQKSNGRNPWLPFERYLADCPSLEDPGPQTCPRVSRKRVNEQTVQKAYDQLAQRWAKVLAPTYAVAAAKRLSLEGPDHANGEHGAEWGSIVHSLLHAAMLKPDADLQALAEGLCLEYGFDGSRAQQLVEAVRGVQGSKVWLRAQKSPNCLVEVPLQVLLDEPGESPSGNTVVRGVLDLAFEEPDGWVIIDYKTDRVGEGGLEHLKQRHGQQLSTYARAWRQATGLSVKETGIFLVGTQQYVPCPVGSASN